MTQESKLKESIISFFYLSLFIVPIMLFAGVVLLLFYTSIEMANSTGTITSENLPLYVQITQWFDPVFFQYNLVLLVFAVAIIPLITLCYVHSMRQEKERRLKRELPPEAFTDQETVEYINNYIGKTFTLRNYLGSMMTLMFVVMFGCMIILLLKPMPLDVTGGTGVDYSKGANFLVLGTYMQSYMLDKTNDYDYIKVLIYTLTAFQFGFLGAYVYFIGLLVRSYFTLDMTPSMFISSSVRMMTGSLLALVLCFFFVDPNKTTEFNEILIKSLPVWSFFIGFFPSRGLTLLENISSKALGLMRIREFTSPLSDLPGINYDHEIRLNREGYDNIENLANANALDLALRTSFSYQQLSQWINQARLYGYLRNDYQIFVDRTGITSLDEFNYYWYAARKQDQATDPAETLITATSTEEHDFKEKILILSKLAEARNPANGISQAPPTMTNTASDAPKNVE